MNIYYYQSWSNLISSIFVLSYPQYLLCHFVTLYQLNLYFLLSLSLVRWLGLRPYFHAKYVKFCHFLQHLGRDWILITTLSLTQRSQYYLALLFTSHQGFRWPYRMQFSWNGGNQSFYNQGTLPLGFEGLFSSYPFHFILEFLDLLQPKLLSELD